MLCGDPSKLTIHKELKIDDPAITDNIVPTPAPVGDNISICDGETVSFENHSNGEGLEHSWTVKPITTELYDPAWNVEYLAGSPTRCLSHVTRNAFLSGYMSGKIRLFSWPIFRQKSVPGMY